jgi:chromosome segregation ATPase
MFVWILIFAGAIIGLLGTFLIASERELKKTRAEVENIATRLDNTPEHGESSSAPVAETEQTTELIARKKELEDEVSSLSSRLRASETGREELTTLQNQLGACQLEKTELQKANQELQNELGVVKNQLETNLSRLTQSGDEHQQLVARAAQYETENSGLKHTLEQSQSRIQALESKETEWAEIEARDARLKEQQQRLESKIAELNQQLTSARQAIHESDTAQAQLRESETMRKQLAGDNHRLESEIAGLNQQLAATRQTVQENDAAQVQLRESESSRRQLADDNQRLQQEISTWQERLAASEEQRRRLSGLRHNLEGLRIKQAAIVATNHQLQQDLDALAQSVETPESLAVETRSGSEAASMSEGPQSLQNESHARDAISEPAPLDHSSSFSGEDANKSATKRRRFGIFPLLMVVTIAAASVVPGLIA